jgi:hypothetical protein
MFFLNFFKCFQIHIYLYNGYYSNNILLYSSLLQRGIWCQIQRLLAFVNRIGSYHSKHIANPWYCVHFHFGTNAQQEDQGYSGTGHVYQTAGPKHGELSCLHGTFLCCTIAQCHQPPSIEGVFITYYRTILMPKS